MDGEEVLDIFDDSMKYIGTATRSEVHKKGYWHKTFNCWIVRKEGNRGYILFQLRGKQKSWFPGRLDITAGGHILAGESMEKSVRELKEEVGISANLEDLAFLGIRSDPFIFNGLLNREFYYTYMLRYDKPLMEYELQADELDGIFEMEIQDGIRFFSGEADGIELHGMRIRNGNKESASMTATRADFVESIDNNFLKSLIMADRYLQGSRYLAV
ncbi:MAG: NUDIX domain-containing protein [Candidatus Micrarchaeota archaeon]|nr:NUDIX domain-containing protein [Candidatus Micrarchaeota archaeon]MDE1847689.1 NUDIX domain-containing protein [Candidatus Micrarchaeota archaeon]MDE1864118.1 NUDIX domain-containing protein [Candidatus Micrarchaeota archaeon]